ncbi:SDR family NAD(P)-dependent oxidoreductase [Desulfohalovibrio reitneri]|uniref:SDR family NAD(P)-dependent oxidoreductase n=1 Tax=Desulfohalovibrio reitneri TaxID=1307759 RepID=UPI0004A6ED62|nr:SDR family oxidoreductase [Desulfohalovibrio reitneri]
MPYVKQKTFVVTGASSGIGRALAIRLAESGASVVLNARRQGLLEETEDACVEHGVRANSVPGDIADPDVARRLVDRALDCGDFSGFFHVAGVFSPGPYLWELDEAGFDAIMDSSVKGAWSMTRAAVPQLIKRRGGLACFFGSGAAEIVQPGIGAYCAAKAAEEHLCRQLAAEAPRVAAFVYRPHVVETRMQEQAREAQGGAAEELHKLFRSWKEEGRLITPEQAAQGVLDLIGEDPGKLTGKTFRWGEGQVGGEE